jgi:hypothetical protein
MTAVIIHYSGNRFHHSYHIDIALQLSLTLSRAASITRSGAASLTADLKWGAAVSRAKHLNRLARRLGGRINKSKGVFIATDGEIAECFDDLDSVGSYLIGIAARIGLPWPADQRHTGVASGKGRRPLLARLIRNPVPRKRVRFPELLEG